MSALANEISVELTAFFRLRSEIRFAYLFGSLAKGTQNRLSDVDVAVFLDGKSLKSSAYRYGYKARLVSELMQFLKTNQVDVVVLNEANPFLKFQVVRCGVPIYEISHRERIQFHVKVLSRYFDLQPFLRIHESRKLFSGSHDR